MVHKTLIFFVLLCITTSLNAQPYFDSYPSYDSVVKVFFSKYGLQNLKSHETFNLEKRPTGWFVSIHDTKGYPEIKNKSTLYWEASTNRFLKLNFSPKIEEYEAHNVLKYTQNYFHLYHSMPLYGYIGWDQDIINILKDKKKLSDSLLYILGRSYSSYASNLLNNYSSLSDPDKRFVLGNGQNVLSESQLDTFRFYQHQAIATYKKIAIRNPDFTTFIGSIRTKYANEVMTAFLQLRDYQNEMEATKELVTGLYSPFQINQAKNILMSCGKNGILFTFGDNDTYQLLYVQAALKYRQDIAIVNMSLFTTSRYINMFRQTILQAPPLPFSIPAELIQPQNKMFAILNDQDSAISLKHTLKLIKASLMQNTISQNNYIKLPSHSFYTIHKNQKMEWDIHNNYIYRSHYMVFDLIYTNQFKRPIHFGQRGHTIDYIGLNPYLKLNGFAYELGLEKKDILEYTNGWVDLETSFDYIMNTYDWSGLSSITRHDALQVNGIRRTFLQTANALIKNNNPKKAKLILDKCLAMFPNSRILFDIQLEGIMEAYYILKEVDSGDLIAEQLYRNYTDETNTIKGKPQKLTRLKEKLNLYGRNDVIMED